MCNIEKSFKDCYVKFIDDKLTIGNSKIKREIIFKNNVPLSISLSSCHDIWSGGNTAMFNVGDFDFENAEIKTNSYISSFGGRSSEALFLEIEYVTTDTSIKQVFYIFPDICAISYSLYLKGKINKTLTNQNTRDTAIEINEETIDDGFVMPEYGVIDTVNIGKNHIKLTQTRILDETDINNELVSETEFLIYNRYNEYYNGSFFTINDYVHNKAMMVVSEGYVTGKKFNTNKDFVINKNFASVFGDDLAPFLDTYTYLGGTTYVLGHKNELNNIYKEYYKKLYKSEETFIMSNTWGDRNRDSAVCEKFILNEIDIASNLGVDIVQIDDGWQKGLTANSSFVKDGPWGDYYDADKNFWDVNPDRFPNGFNVVKDYAESKGIKLGLWFSMDKGDNYRRWETDAKRVLDLYKEYGITYFKIDGLQIINPTCEQNIKNFVTMVDTNSDGKINFNFDITASRRFGYFLHKQYSTLFVENRYTDWPNYYPFRTLRNVWGLSKYFPCHKFQFELLNEQRNIDKYGDDILKPSNCDIDYLFASVMVANPLVWMEMSGLCDSQIEKLKGIISHYKNERSNFVDAKITPIGDKPDGMSYTGFNIEGKDSSYLILLKEYASDNDYIYKIDDNISSYDIICKNTDSVKIDVNKNTIMVKDMDKCSYLFIKYTK